MMDGADKRQIFFVCFYLQESITESQLNDISI